MIEKDSRSPRTMSTRETDERPKQWAPPSLLPDPEPVPGYSYRWVRTAIYGAADPANISKQFREGWRPVNAADHPELMTARDANSKFKDGIEIGGLLLCRIPTETIMQRQKHFDLIAKQQLQAVDNNYMRENDPRMPLLKPERRTDVVFGGGGKPGVPES